MGIYFNPNNLNFKQTLAAEIYIDKTMLLAVTNRYIRQGNACVCFSRPRRFGKTIASEMLAAYYSKGCDSRELFDPYRISCDPSFEEGLNRFNVIQIDVNAEYQFASHSLDMLERLTEKIKREIEDWYGDIKFEKRDSLPEVILKVYHAKGDTFIIIMDEYDVLVREQVEGELFNKYLSFLNGLFKSAPMKQAISLAYLTGILPIVRDKVQSKLNNFNEYTILNAMELSEYVGFTAEEVKELCESMGVDYEECRRWYDGYRLNGYEIYNPESVVQAVRTGEFENYWNKTSTYQAIAERIEQDFDGIREDVIRMLSGESVDVNPTMFMNTLTDFRTKDDVFTYLIHLGYLAYDRKERTCRIPNKEVEQEWINTVSINSDYSVTNKIIKESKELLLETINGNEQAVASSLDVSHIHVTSNRSYNNEDALQSAVYLAYIYALNEYTIVREMTAGRGFADVVFIPFKEGRPAMIIELKRNDCAETALNQIRNKRYFDSLARYQGDLLFVGINYDEKEKTHTCKIERFMK